MDFQLRKLTIPLKYKLRRNNKIDKQKQREQIVHSVLAILITVIIQ